KKGKKFQWDGRCQAAFEQIKEYLQNPPVLSPPEPERPLILYLLVTETTMGCMLALKSEDEIERAIYYLSKKMLEYETRYTPLEKACLALVWATR
ncbi:ribonuclease H family protein, partial [Klebsiella pneumoniae]|uniref:ribonuclease H family protein n=1 Tax=Klebsiella pneumoniae TaxID=573 RepID=UPI00210D59BB